MQKLKPHQKKYIPAFKITEITRHVNVGSKFKEITNCFWHISKKSSKMSVDVFNVSENLSR